MQTFLISTAKFFPIRLSSWFCAAFFLCMTAPFPSVTLNEDFDSMGRRSTQACSSWIFRSNIFLRKNSSTQQVFKILLPLEFSSCFFDSSVIKLNGFNLQSFKLMSVSNGFIENCQSDGITISVKRTTQIDIPLLFCEFWQN